MRCCVCYLMHGNLLAICCNFRSFGPLLQLAVRAWAWVRLERWLNRWCYSPNICRHSPLVHSTPLTRARALHSITRVFMRRYKTEQTCNVLLFIVRHTNHTYTKEDKTKRKTKRTHSRIAHGRELTKCIFTDGWIVVVYVG